MNGWAVVFFVLVATGVTGAAQFAGRARRAADPEEKREYRHAAWFALGLAVVGWVGVFVVF